MKRSIIILGSLAILGASLTSCEDFLNDNRDPMSQQTVNAAFWANPTNVENQLNYFYETFTGYGNGTGQGNYYFTTCSDDQSGAVGGVFRDWRVSSVPTSSSSWNDPYTEIRRASLIIKGVTGSSMIEADKAQYLAVARLFRAYNYYLLVRAYGDVPSAEDVVDVDQTETLYSSRTNRNDVMDFALEDLNYAVKNIATQSSKTYFSKDLANAMKAEICLFEGTYSKYVAQNTARATTYLKETVDACEAIMNNAEYALGDYKMLYNSHNGELASNPEVILAKCYKQGVFMHSVVDWTSGSTPISGISKDAFDSFLLLTGELPNPGVDDIGVMDAKGLSIANVLAIRDKRLSAITYDHVMYQDFPYGEGNTSQMTSTTGYGIKKYNDGVTHSQSDATTANKNYNDCPIYWLAEIYLDYAEAKAELGQFEPADFEKSIKKLYDRAGVDMTLAKMQSLDDPKLKVKMTDNSLINEIRRCRRCELMLDNDIRYWDLVRWNKLSLLDTQKYPEIRQGANLKNATVEFPTNNDGYMDPIHKLFGDQYRVYSAKYDRFPIPSKELMLVKAKNPKYEQNPGW